MTIERVFLDHPHRVNESFFEHMFFALAFSGRLFKASAAAFLHAFVPSLCETTASQAIMDMHAEIAARRVIACPLAARIAPKHERAFAVFEAGPDCGLAAVGRADHRKKSAQARMSSFFMAADRIDDTADSITAVK